MLPGAGRRGGGQPGAASRLERRDRVLVAQGECDLVHPLEEAPTAEVVELEGLLRRRGAHAELLEVDGDLGGGVVEDRIHECSDRLGRELDRKQPDLAAVVSEDIEITARKP